MKRHLILRSMILTVVTLFLFLTLGLGISNAEGPFTGTWEVKYKITTSEFTDTLHLIQDGNKITGTDKYGDKLAGFVYGNVAVVTDAEHQEILLSHYFLKKKGKNKVTGKYWMAAGEECYSCFEGYLLWGITYNDFENLTGTRMSGSLKEVINPEESRIERDKRILEEMRKMNTQFE